MKSIKATAVVALGLGILVGGCAKKTIAPEEVGKTLAIVLCEKHTGCQQTADFNKEQCIQEISAGLSERLAGKEGVKVNKVMLDACTKAITSGNCELLQSEAPTAGCEFLL